MTTEKYIKIKNALAVLMQEFEDVPESEQQAITHTTQTVQDKLSEISRGLNRHEKA